MIYFDNSATTKPSEEVLKTYLTVSQDFFGNPSSLHRLGEKSFNLLQQARRQVAELIGVRSEEIFFTSGGTEGDNWVIKGSALAKRKFGNHIIASSIEHPAVLNALQQLERQGFEVTYLPVDKNGFVDIKKLADAIKKSTILVTVMAVNNEIGSIQPIEKISDILNNYPKIHFHVDAVQAIGKGLMDMLRNERIDFLTFSGHKFHAPRGVGFIYKKSGRVLEPLMSGGGQESNQRSGTENLPAIVAQAKALRLLLENESKKVILQQKIRTKIYEHIAKFEKIRIFSDLNTNFAPHILCFAIKGVRGETIVHAFEKEGIFISTTSACSSKKKIVSNTLNAMNIPEKIATSAVRISLDENNSIEEAETFNKIFDKLYFNFSKLNS